MSSRQLVALKRIIENVDTLLIYAGAGMSVELGNVPYWSGSDAKYGGGITKYGLSPLQHATGDVWRTHPDKQVQYVEDTRNGFLNNLNRSTSNLYIELLGTIRNRGLDYHVVTSNVDDAFLHYGYDESRVYEKHGNYFYTQCSMEHEQDVKRTIPGVFVCGKCGAFLRPNVLMFEDSNFSDLREVKQWFSYDSHLKEIVARKDRTLVLEIGVGTTVLNVRDMAMKAYYQLQTAPYIHVNKIQDGTNNYAQLARLKSLPIPSGKELWVLTEAAEVAVALQ